MKKLIYLSILLLFSIKAIAQYPTLLKDINTTGENSPNGFITYNNIVYYTHDDNVHGKELWRTDGTATGTYMLKEICAGYRGSNPSNYILFKGSLFFTAFTVANGVELWKTDGTEAGTVLVKDIWAGTNSGTPTKLTDCDAFLLFSATDATNGTEIWKSNGTTAGTSIFADLTPGTGSSVIEEIILAGSFFSANIYFTARNNGFAYARIYATGYGYFGTPTLFSPTLVVDASGTLNTNGASGLCWYNFSLYFMRLEQLFCKYDGTNITSIKNFTTLFSPTISFNSKMYFLADNGTNGRELWQSDGTTAGTILLKDINVGAGSSSPNNFLVGNTQLYFVATDGVGFSNAIWKTDGTTAGTVKASNNNISSAKALVAIDNDILYFQTGGTDSYTKLYKYDHATNTTTTLKNPLTSTYYTADYGAALLGHTLIFNGYEYFTGVEVWKTDGTVAGTSMVKDVSKGGSEPYGFISVGANTFFTATQNVYSVPHISNGTAAGTQKLAEIYPDIFKDEIFKNVNGTVFFAADDIPRKGFELYKTDGTTTGTVMVKDINATTTSYVSSSNPDHFCDANGTLFFSATDGINGDELWKSDDTAAGTVIVKDIYAGSSDSSPYNLTYLNGFVYFFANDNVNGYGLMRSDGSPTGTTFIKALNPAVKASNMIVFNSKLYFTANDATNGTELWVSDGTNTGTMLLKDIRTGSTGSNPANLTTNGTIIYFTADNGINGVELWKSDGTAAGTTILNIGTDTPNITGSNPQNLTFVGNGTVLFFSASIPSIGREVWRTDGTLANTFYLKDINPVAGTDAISSTFTQKFPVIGPYIFFPANDGGHGTELWKSNGSTAGTTMVVDLFEGFNNDGLYPDARIYATLSSQIFMEATNGQNGRELWSFSFCPNTLNINTLVSTTTQKQQASVSLTSSSNIANTDFTFGDLTAQYTAGKFVELQPGFQVISKQLNPLIAPAVYRQTYFRVDIGGCN